MRFFPAPAFVFALRGLLFEPIFQQQAECQALLLEGKLIHKTLERYKQLTISWFLSANKFVL